jgi:hypothetical protein
MRLAPNCVHAGVNALPSVPISGVGHHPVQLLHEGSTMSYSANVQTGAPLGVGAIVSESFSILMKHFVSVVILAFVPTLVGNLVSGGLIGWGVMLGTQAPQGDSAAQIFIPIMLSVAVQLVVYGLATALLVQLAYDAKLDRPLRMGSYMGPALGSVLPIAILGIVAGILVVLGFVALIIPGLWLYAVFSVMSPAVVIEKVGFGGLGRSAALTKEYRWPILGAIIIIGIINFVIGLIAQWIVGMLVSASGGGIGGVVIFLIFQSLITSISFGLGSITIALIYARLREIKEGTSVRDIAAVFD